MNSQKHILSVTVRDEPGVLVRIAGLFARRGFNIESLAVAPSGQEGISKTTFVVTGDDNDIDQVEKQLQKLIDIIEVTNHTNMPFVDRELMLVKVRVSSPDDRVEIRQIAQDFRASIVDVHREALIFEVTGDEGKMSAFIEQMRSFGIIELIRSGRVALTRSAATIELNSETQLSLQKLQSSNNEILA